VEPDGRGAGATVIDEGDGAAAEIFYIAADVGDGENGGGGFAFFVLEQSGGSGGLVGNRLAADADGVIGGERFFFGRGGVGGRFGVSAGLGFGGLRVFLRFLRRDGKCLRKDQ